MLGRKPYRGDDVYAPSADFSGAVSQVLDPRFKLQNELLAMKNNMLRYDIHSYAVRCIVVAGMMPQEHHQKKSFELARNALSNVDIVTFDELLARLVEIQNALQHAPQKDLPF